MGKIVLASNNSAKVAELQALLNKVKIIPQSELSVSAVEETGLTFIENAIIKARHACEATGLPSLADDSGLIVDSLDGTPGIYSSRYAGPQCNNQDNIAKLLQNLEAKPKAERRAFFYCIIVFMRTANDPTPLIGEGKWPGEILTESRGTAGFGYDPIFYVPTHQCSAAELSREEKNRISHRGQALKIFQRLYNA